MPRHLQHLRMTKPPFHAPSSRRLGGTATLPSSGPRTHTRAYKNGIFSNPFTQQGLSILPFQRPLYRPHHPQPESHRNKGDYRLNTGSNQVPIPGKLTSPTLALANPSIPGAPDTDLAAPVLAAAPNPTNSNLFIQKASISLLKPPSSPISHPRAYHAIRSFPLPPDKSST